MNATKMFAILLAVGLVAGMSNAATIAWGPATNVSAPSDVSTNGTVVEAYNAQLPDITGSPTVNGVTFTGTNDLLGYNSPGGDWYSGDTGDSAYNLLLSSADTGLAGGSTTITLGDGDGDPNTSSPGLLNVGDDYEIQVWFADTRGYFNDDERYYSPGDPGVVLDYTGQYSIGTFTADAATQDLTIETVQQMAPTVNAYQIRNVTEPDGEDIIPEPATMCMLGLAVAGLGGYVRRRRKGTFGRRRMMNATKALAMLLAFGMFVHAASLASGAIVYESFDYSTGGLNGQTADSGLGAWSATGSGRCNILTPGKTYTDGNGNVLPVQGNYVELSGKSPDAHANADILTAGWSAGSVDGTRLNKKGATIWWSAIVNQIDGKYGYTYLYLRSDDGGEFGLRPDWHGPSWANPWKMRGKNDDGTALETTFGVSGDTERFLLMKLDSDATTGDTTFSLWANPLLDSEASLGAPHGQLTVLANADGSVTHFDRLYMGHTSTHGEQMRVDEIRMGESFASVVGQAAAGIEVGATAGTWDVTRAENPSPEILEVDKTGVDMGPFDMEIEVAGGQSLIQLIEQVLNESPLGWEDYHFQLGTGLGDQFVPSVEGDGLGFAAGGSSQFANLLLSEDELSFGGGLVPIGALADFDIQIELPGDDPYTFTLRQTPTVPEPASAFLVFLGLGALGRYGRRRTLGA